MSATLAGRLRVQTDVGCLVMPQTSAIAQDRPKIEVVTSIQHSDDVTSVAFSPDGARVLSGSKDATVRLWDVGPARCCAPWRSTPEVSPRLPSRRTAPRAVGR